MRPRSLAGDPLLLAGGRVCDGSGKEPVRADLLIEGDRIAALGPDLDRAGASLLDVTGLVVAPGFIDLHSHADFVFPLPLERSGPLLEGRIRQGITTEILGNCGLGIAPAVAGAEAILPGLLSWMRPDDSGPCHSSVASWLDAIERAGPPVNVGTLLPHGPVRLGAMQLRGGPADAGERARMLAAVEAGLDEGAFGLSTGLIYAPGIFTSPEEIRPLASALARKGRLYASHIRGSSELLLDAVEELLDVARSTGCAVHHSHSEAVGRTHWRTIPLVLAREEAARRSGLRVSFDMFPYTVAATMLIAIYPPWSLEGGPGALIERLREPGTRARIGADIEGLIPRWPPWDAGGWPHNLVAAVGWEGISIASVATRENRRCEGQNLLSLGRSRGRHPFDAVSDLLIEEEGRVGMWVAGISGCQGAGDPGGTGGTGDVQALDALVLDPAGAFCTDALDTGRGLPHPAAYGAFPRVLGHIVRERGLLSLGEAVRRLTNRPAAILGLKDRGRLEPGCHADLVVFEPEEVEDTATLAAPRQMARGIPYVFVNGHALIDGGDYRPSASGRVLRAT